MNTLKMKGGLASLKYSKTYHKVGVINCEHRRGTVAHAWNPSTLEAKASGSQGHEFKTSLAKMVKPHLY